MAELKLTELQQQVVARIQQASVSSKSGCVKFKTRGLDVVVPDVFAALEAAFANLSTFRIVLTRKSNIRIQYSIV
jgi:hypothetical protein